MIEFVIRRKVLISMLFIGLSLLGYISYRNIPVELLPEVELPFLIVQVNSAREMDPQYIEKQAVIPLEGAIGTLNGIEKIESYADRNNGRLYVYYKPDVDLKYAYLKLQEKVDGVKSNLSEDFFVWVYKIDTESLANILMQLQVRGSGGMDRIRYIFEDKIRKKLEAINGIVNVQLYGGQEKSVEIVLNSEAAKEHGLTISRLRSLIAANNLKKIYLGHVLNYQQKHHVNLIADYTDISDLENIIIDSKIPIYLKDIAEINFAVKEETSISRVNGKEAITVNLIRDSGVNLIELSHATREVISDINKSFKSQDIEIVVQYDSAEYLEENINLVQELALTGGLLAILILWFFLNNLRLVVVLSLALPISILTAFNLLYAFDITLNSLTLVGIALAVGMLLDNSIVVLENIYRVLQKKKNSAEAAAEGTKEIWRSIFAATLTTVIVFLPFIFASNFFIRILGYQIGISIISTLCVSLIVALLLIPMITNIMLNIKGAKKEQINPISRTNRLIQIYTLLLKSTMRFPTRTIVLAIVLFFASALIVLAVSITSQDEVELRDFNLFVTMPGGSTLETTDAAVADVEKRLSDIPELQDLVSQIFEDEATLTLKLKEDFKSINNRDVEAIKEDIKKRIDRFSAAEVSFDQPQQSKSYRGGNSGGVGGGLQNLLGLGSQNEKVVIKGHDIGMMRKIADDINYQIDDLTTVENSNVIVGGERPEVHLLFDKTLMNMFNISLNSVVSELSSFQKEVNVNVKFKHNVDEYDIVIRTENTEDKKIDDLRTLKIQGTDSTTFDLQQLSKIIYTQGSSTIERVNQERQIEVIYRFKNEVSTSNTFLQSARTEVDLIVDKLAIPSGIAIEVIHDETDLSDFYFLIGIAFILIYMILAAVFESFLNPIVIMFTIPLAAIGSFWSIIITGNTLFNATTLIGFLILLGIVVNNGIILIDFTRILRKKGNSRSRALITAGQARLRPILITAITTIVAMLPLAMGREEYVTRIAAPFAITVIGGLSLSTVFTLVFIPTVYSGLEGFIDWFKNLNWKVRLLQTMAILFGAIIIYDQVESNLWRFANLFLLLFSVPGVTYFLLQSLKQAKSELISKNETIKIKITKLVKIYDRPGRFLLEWRKKERIDQRYGKKPLYASWQEVRESTWQYLIFIFLIYYVYFYLANGFWVFVLSHLIYFYGIFLLTGLQNLFSKSEKLESRKWLKTINKKSLNFFVWVVPAANLVFFYFSWQNIILIILIGFLWYFALTVYFTSKRLTDNLINPNKLEGKYKKIRSWYYKLILAVPILGKKKKPFKALDRVSLEIGSGMFGLLGPNGAGKTTLMRIICGILEQNYGTIYINEFNVKDKREELQGLIGYLPQDFGTYENMTAYEFLDYQAILKGITNSIEREKRINYVISAVHLEQNKNDKIGSFSGGMKQRIGIAQTLLHLPRILVVDEPTAGLDPRERIRFRNLLVELSRECIVIFSTHIIEDVASSCDRVAVLNYGEVRYLGEPKEMVKLAENHVWQLLIPRQEFEEKRKTLNVVHHAKIGDNIRLRCLADKKPYPDAKVVKPTLEDAYLWLLSQSDISDN